MGAWGNSDALAVTATTDEPAAASRAEVADAMDDAARRCRRKVAIDGKHLAREGSPARQVPGDS